MGISDLINIELMENQFDMADGDMSVALNATARKGSLDRGCYPCSA